MTQAPHASEIVFTPFTSTLKEPLDRAMLAVFGPEMTAWQDHAMHRDGDPLAIIVAVGDAPQILFELATPNAERRAFMTGKHVALSYRKPPGGEDTTTTAAGRAVIEAVRARLVAADTAGDPIVALRQALIRHRAYEPLSDWMFRQSGPRDVLIRLGFRCNQDCAFCWQGRQWPEPPAHLYQTWLDEMAAAGRTRVSFSGGEPTLHKELPKLIAHATGLGLTSWIQTNAIQLAKPRVLRALVEAGLQGAFVSYHSPDAATSDRMTRAPGTHERTRAGIAAALEAGLLVEVNCVVERENYRQLEAHAEDVVASFVEPFEDNPLRLVAYSHPCEYYDEAQWRQSVVDLDEVRPHLIAALSRLHNDGVAVEGIGTCGFPPCLLSEEPALLKWVVPEHQHEMDVAGRTYAPDCDRCVVKSRCLGLRAEYIDAVGAWGVRPFTSEP